MNIPIYRAKKIDSDEYVEGLVVRTGQGDFIFQDEPSDIEVNCHNKLFPDGAIDGEICINSICYEVCFSTLSIHFPDMLDSEGNKIFASLSEDGRGGDLVEYNTKKEVVKYSLGTIQTYMFRFEDLIDIGVKVIGIQE